MEKFSFFNDVNDDRVYYAEDWARHLKKYFTNGIFNNELNVVSNNDMTITIKEGDANIEGYRYTNTGDLVKTIDNADGTLNRIDNVVLRLDLTNRLISAQIIKGTFADKPVAPELVRTSTIYDLRIAKISIPAGTTTITQDLITDTRFITSDCGNVISTVQTPDTENLFIQMQTLFEKQINELNNNFEIWFDSIKNQLDSDAAGNLQNQINNLNSNKVDNAKFDLDSNNLQLLANGKNVGDSVHIPTGITDTATGEEDLKIVNNRGVVKFSLEGKTEQKSYIGKNFWKLYNTQTVNGVTLTQNDDGSILLNGTATGDTFFRIILDETINEATTLSCDYKSGIISGASVYIRTRTSNNAIKYSIDVGPSTAPGIQLDRKTTENYYQEITIQKGAICSNVLLEIMLLKGSYNGDTLPLFEPYVGGTQSPNPDYPQEIENIKGIENIWFGGESTTVNGVTFTKNSDGSYDISGTATADANCYGYANVTDSKLVNNKVYTISINKLYSSSVGILTETLADSTWVSHAITPLVINNNISNYKYITIQDNVTKIRYGLRVTKGTTVDVKGLKIQLEEGTIAHTFVLPGSNYLLFNNKSNNLANIKDIKIGKNWINVSDSARASILNISVKPNTLYTLDSNININSHLTTIRVVQFDKLGSITHLGIKSGKFVTDNNVNYVSIEILADMTISEDMLKNIWISLAEGDIAPNIPYFNHDILIDLKGNNLCSNKDKTIKDDLIIENGIAKIYKKFSEYTFTGNETFGFADKGARIMSNNERISQLKNVYIPTLQSSSNITPSFCTHYTVDGQGNVVKGSNKFGFSQYDNAKFIYFPADYSTIDEFKAKLKSLYEAGTPVRIQYPLAEPEVIELGKVDFELLEGNSTLNLEEDLKSNMSIKYYTDSTVVDLKKKVENKQNVILHGTTAPSNDLGADGDIYLQHN